MPELNNPSLPQGPPRRRHETLFLALYFGNFEAQVIAAYDPAYRGRPFVVASRGSEEDLAVALAVSPWVTVARPLAGVPLHVLRRRYPAIAIVSRQEEFERASAAELAKIYEQYTPAFEIGRRGQSLLDLTGTPSQRTGLSAAIDEIREAIRTAIGLQQSAVGAGSRAFIARIMARLARPEGVVICPPGREAETLSPLNSSLLPGLSDPCRERLRQYGLLTIGQIQAVGAPALVERLGSEGEALAALVNGIDARPHTAKAATLFVEQRLEADINDSALLVHTMRLVADRLCHELRMHGLAAPKVTVAIRYRDGRTGQKTVTFPAPADDFDTVATATVGAFAALYTRRVGVRTMSLSVNAPATPTYQLSLFETQKERRRRLLGDAIVKVRRRNTFAAVLSGSDVTAAKGL
jgi:DNA polymerase-4